ncbi:MAG: TatD family hydrolase [Oscillospiraceae bacterium]|jgi:TatD DNase family protein|nr:TatD family hydrolase [Oscillospiraceae bacterium]
MSAVHDAGFRGSAPLSNLIDTHAHLDDARFDSDRADVLRRMADAGVTRCVTIGADRGSSEAAVILAESPNPYGIKLYAAVGVHPENAAAFTASDEAWTRALTLSASVKAIGEIGLDYHYDDGPPRDVQRLAFKTQFAWAGKWNLPVVLHIRDAHDEMLEFLSSVNAARPREIILHCYSGDWERAQAYLDLGCVISFSGNTTFKNARNLHETARNIPLDRLLIETDCPYLAPEPMRGKRNEPAFVAYTAARIAELRGIDPQELAAAASANAIRIFDIN